jgi:ApbE superfamily uncharacterized protein (UPF0280 family)
MWEQPVVQILTGDRMHLQHGPIDIVLKCWGSRRAVADAYTAANHRFQSILGELVGELDQLRKPMSANPIVAGPIARRMVAACWPFTDRFVTPMAAVAGAVAQDLLATMLDAAPLSKAFVNDGGDIAIHLAPGEAISVGVAANFSAGEIPALNGNVTITADDPIRGIATSGRRGRSFSLGIADSVTILARDAATADVAATLVGNAVDLDAPAIIRRPARALDPDSDLADLPVTVEVGPLTPSQISTALARGRAQAENYLRRGLIAGAAMTLQSQTEIVGSATLLQAAKGAVHA